jgi:hypothetical protein
MAVDAGIGMHRSGCERQRRNVWHVLIRVSHCV